MSETPTRPTFDPRASLWLGGLSPLERVQRIGAHLMDDMLAEFKPGAKITLMVRTPGEPDCDFLMTSDDLSEAAEMKRRRQASDV